MMSDKADKMRGAPNSILHTRNALSHFIGHVFWLDRPNHPSPNWLLIYFVQTFGCGGCYNYEAGTFKKSHSRHANQTRVLHPSIVKSHLRGTCSYQRRELYASVIARIGPDNHLVQT
jgi:hypothetical protein